MRAVTGPPLACWVYRNLPAGSKASRIRPRAPDEHDSVLLHHLGLRGGAVVHAVGVLRRVEERLEVPVRAWQRRGPCGQAARWAAEGQVGVLICLRDGGFCSSPRTDAYVLSRCIWPNTRYNEKGCIWCFLTPCGATAQNVHPHQPLACFTSSIYLPRTHVGHLHSTVVHKTRHAPPSRPPRTYRLTASI